MVRGVGKMEIFPLDTDKLIYLDHIGKVKKEMGFALLAYCLMGNHAHLLIRDERDGLSLAMKRIGIRYAQHFNKSYGRVGHVFQGRFKSQVIESLRQCLVCARYIHNNPVKAGIVPSAEHYPWSSYNAYISSRKTPLVERELILSEYSADPNVARQELTRFTQALDREMYSFPEDEVRPCAVDQVRDLFRLENVTPTAFKQLNRKKRSELVTAIKKETAASLRDLEEVLGVSKSSLARLLKS